MIKQDNRSPLSNETDEKIRRLKELLDASDEQENTDTEQTNAAQSTGTEMSCPREIQKSF